MPLPYSLPWFNLDLATCQSHSEILRLLCSRRMKAREPGPLRAPGMATSDLEQAHHPVVNGVGRVPCGLR